MISYKLHFVGYTFQNYTLLIKNVTVELNTKHCHHNKYRSVACLHFQLPQKSRTPGDFFCPLRAFSYKYLISTNQTEETNKQIKLRWREVDQSLMAMLSVWKTV